MGLKIENFTDELTAVYHDKAHDLAGTQHDGNLLGNARAGQLRFSP